MAKWPLTDEQYEFIKGEVTNIFVKYNIRCVPVSGFEIATRMGIKLIPYSSLSEKKLAAAMKTSEDGFFLEVNGFEKIYYNDIGKSYERQNWTILHEIGHVVLDHSDLGPYEEEEANFFAKYAIAPPILIYKLHLDSPMEIYEYFDLTYQEAEYAYNYFCRWKRKKKTVNKLTEYEILLIKQFESA